MKNKVRIEIHLTPEETKKLDKLAEKDSRKRKPFCEKVIRNAIAKAVILLMLFSFGCKKKETEYAILFEVKGKSSYVYQVGSVNRSGSTASSVTINEVAHDGDYVKCVATGDSSKIVKLEYYRDGVLRVGQNANVAEAKEQL